jgi:hemolysin III
MAGILTRALPAAGRPLHEELVSAALQGCAALASIAGLVLLLRQAGPAGPVPIVGAAIYGASLILAYAASAAYHGIPEPRLKRLFRTLDHCTIFFLIAGTYTPIALVALSREHGWLLLALIWPLAILGVALRLAQGPRFHRVAIALYLAMGWLGIAWGKALYDAAGVVPVLLIVLGGCAYTGGLVFYRWDRLRFNVALWHVSVVTGSALHFLAVARCLSPAASI